MQMSVLVAEDDASTRRALMEVLRAEGLHAIGAADGLQAWDLYQQSAPDFVCLDVMMPGISGYEVCRRIRAVNSTVPVVFITAKGEEVDAVVGLEIGADDYIVKPFGVKEVVARIRALARRCLKDYKPRDADCLPSTEFALGNWLINPMEMRARSGDQVLDLSLREVKILALLVRYAGRVVDRNAIMHFAWKQEYYPNSRTLDQHISLLRKRIETDPKNPTLIQTVHGVGYRYDPTNAAEHSASALP